MEGVTEGDVLKKLWGPSNQRRKKNLKEGKKFHLK